jgi:hypothetical protein
MARKPTLPDQDQAYADLVSSITEQMTSWRQSDEPPDEFAKRLIGQARQHERKMRG